MLKAVVFDSDGTLINSFELIVAAYTHVANEHGLKPPTAAEVRKQLGKSLPDIYESFYPGHDVDALIQTNSEFITAHAGESAAFDGLHDMLEALKGMGFKLAILTGGNHRIEDVLKHHNIRQYFDSVVHCERVTHPKPHPEGLLLALDECGVGATDAIMVGDSVQDIEAGKNAKVAMVIAVTHGIGKREDLARAGADYFVDSLIELQNYLLRHHQAGRLGYNIV